MNRKTKLTLQIILGVVAIFLTFMLFESIMEPVHFHREKNKRAEAVVVKLKDIRTVQEAYKKAFGKFINDIDSVALFLENGVLPYIKMIGTVPDSLTEEEAVELKIVSRETFEEDAYTVLFPKNDNKESHIANLVFIPYTDNIKFDLEAGFIAKSGYSVPVFEAKVPFEVLLEDMDEQLVRNDISKYKDLNKYPGIKVGSMTDAITEGNWE